MTAPSQRVLVTSALPYANGSIHLGHLVEYIQTDIYVRFLKMTGHEVIYICADDTHGAPIEINARKQGVSPEEFIAQFHDEHQRDFDAFGIEFDIFYTTHSEENRAWANRIYEALRDGGHIVEKDKEQLFCETDQRFLPDRFVKGICPACKEPDQYGDVCESCGATYDPADLIEPQCSLCGSTPVPKTSTHLYVQLSHFQEFLEKWTAKGTLQPEIKNFVDGWLKKGLKDWCVTRDAPYFGFEVPDRPGKYFYVWLDAPIGYISSTQKWAEAHGKNVADYWERPGVRIIHFIGRDIVYFHTLFWPAMLEGAGLQLPERVIVHGMLMVNGAKMSKTRGTFINASEYLEHLEPEWLRYYYAGNLSAKADDLDLNFDDFHDRINAELVNNIVNLAHRAISFAGSKLGGKVSQPLDAQLEKKALAAMDRIRAHYEALEFRKAMKEINELADLGNRYFQEAAPWSVVKEDEARARGIVTDCVNLAKLLAIALKPVVPTIAAQLEEELGTGELSWDDVKFDVVDRTLGEARPLVGRVDKKKIEALLSRDDGPAKDAPNKKTGKKNAAPKTPGIIDFDQFMDVELKVGLVISARKVEGADKLLELAVDVGEAGPRTIVAGIAQSYEPEAVTGKRVVVVTNLAPRKLRGVESQGMLLAAGPGGAQLTLAEIGGDVAPGTRVK